MRFLAFTDIHGEEECIQALHKRIKQERPDFFICAGDISFIGHRLPGIIEKLASWKIEGFMIHGNHDSASVMMHELGKFKHLHFCHGKLVQKGDLTIAGWGGGGFGSRDLQFKAFIDKNRKDLALRKNVILVTHAPPLNTTLDDIYGDHVGNQTFRDFLGIAKGTILGLAGHIHECFGAKDMIGPVPVCNPGPEGMMFEWDGRSLNLLEK